MTLPTCELGTTIASRHHENTSLTTASALMLQMVSLSPSGAGATKIGSIRTPPRRSIPLYPESYLKAFYSFSFHSLEEQ